MNRKPYACVEAKSISSGMDNNDFAINQMTAQKILKVLVGREDVYSEESLGYGGKRETKMQAFPVNEQIIREHLNGGKTIDTYIQRPNGTVKYMIFDVDVSKKIMFQHERGSEIYDAYMEKALNISLEIVKMLRENGMQGYIEYSGCRGYHIWLFFTEWIPVRYVHMFCDLLEQKFLKATEGISIEFFPNKTRVREGKFGQVMKLPYGFHTRTQERSYFLDDNLPKITDINVFLDSIAKVSLNAIKKVLAANSGRKEEFNEKAVDRNLEIFGELPENVSEILKNCNLMCYLCQKAAKTGYLTHFERLSILYVFGHLGEEGEQFVHQVMAFTLNYQYNTTERFIKKLPSKPISCLKLREQYKQITAEFGCNCNFKRSKNCYPSPVLHAILLSNGSQEEITIPTSRTMTKENEKKVIDEINIHKKAQELASKILEMKKQKRGLDAAIAKVEKELGKIYDNIGVDCLEIEMGLLVRKKSENGYEWIIEI